MFNMAVKKKKIGRPTGFHYEEKGWVAKDACNLLYLYVMTANGQVASVAELQFNIYTVQFIATQSKQFIFNYYSSPL